MIYLICVTGMIGGGEDEAIDSRDNHFLIALSLGFMLSIFTGVELFSDRWYLDKL
jgi:hypothetical protein